MSKSEGKMKYGTNQENLTLKCANCGKVVSKNGAIEQNYCSNCGAPLSIMAIAEYAENVKDSNREMLAALAGIAKKNNTDSFTKILEIYDRM